MNPIVLAVFDDFFNALVFGSGAWIGFLLFVIILIVIQSLSKYSCIITFTASVLLALLYFQHTTTNPDLVWFAILMSVLAIFSLLFRKE